MAEEGSAHSQVGDAGGLHVGQGCSVGTEGRGAVDQGAVLSQALQGTNPVLTSLLETHFLCHLPPESHTEQGVNATLQTPPAHLLSSTPGCSRGTLLPSASLRLQEQEEEEEKAVLPCQCAGTPAAVRMPSHTAGFQHCGILPSGEQLSTIPPPWTLPSC